MKASIDKEKCIGCGTCEALCEAVFEVSNGKSSLKKDKLSDKDTLCVEEAVKTCPTQAIKLE